jgi:hypothetical protein
MNGMGREFIYNSGRCVELASKAALLFNSEPVVKFGHNLTRMISELKKDRFKDVFFDKINNSSGKNYITFETSTSFVDFLSRYDYPSIRYNPHGHIFDTNFIQCMDHTFFNILFMCTNLDSPYSHLIPSLTRRKMASDPKRNFVTLKYLIQITPTWKKWLLNNSSSDNILLYRNKFLSDYAAENENCAPDYESKLISTTETPVVEIIKYIIGDSNDEVTSDIRSWMTESFKMSESTKREFGIK